MEQNTWILKWMLQPVRMCKKGCIGARVMPALLQEYKMKITKTQLRVIINEELNAALLKENIIADMAEKIADSGEDAWDWIKDNAEDVKDAAAAAGEAVADFADDVAQAALKTIDKTAGTAFSPYGQQKKADAAALRRRNAAAQAASAEEQAAISAGYADEQDVRDQQDADKRRRDQEYEDSPEGQRRRAQQVKRAQEDEYERKGYKARDEEEREREADERRRNRRSKGQEWGEKYESISRKKLERIVKEELQKVLKE